MSKYNEWNSEEMDRLKELRDEGYGYLKIGELLDKDLKDVRNQVIKSGLLSLSKEELSERLVGHKKFRKDDRDRVVNQILYGVMWVQDEKVSELADKLPRSVRSVQRWIYDGVIPDVEMQRRVENILGVSRLILFNEDNFNKIGE